MKVDAQRFEDTAADAVLERVVAEEGEVAGPAAGRDAGQDRDTQAAHAVAGEGIEVGGRRGFQFRLDRGRVGFLHRHQGHQLQVGQLQGALPEGNLVHRTAEDHQDFQRADLDGVIGQPQPRRRAVEWPGQGVMTHTQQP